MGFHVPPSLFLTWVAGGPVLCTACPFGSLLFSFRGGGGGGGLLVDFLESPRSRTSILQPGSDAPERYEGELKAPQLLAHLKQFVAGAEEEASSEGESA